MNDTSSHMVAQDLRENLGQTIRHLASHGQTLQVVHQGKERATLSPIHLFQGAIPPEVASSEARDRLYELLGLQRSVTITHHGKPIAVLNMQEHRAWRTVSSNISGGEGKTTLVRELGLMLAAQGERVALIDMDIQGSLTRSLGLLDSPDSPASDPRHSVLPAFQEVEQQGLQASDDTAALSEPIRTHGLDIWVSNAGLYDVHSKVRQNLALMTNLRAALDRIERQYDHILIDTGPAENEMLSTAIIAADWLIIAVQSEKGTEGLSKLAKMMRLAGSFGHTVKPLMFVPSRQKANTGYSQELIAQLQSGYGDMVAPPVRDSIKVQEAARNRVGVAEHAGTSPVTRDFEAVLEFYRDRLKRQ